MSLGLLTAALFSYMQYAAWAVAMGRSNGGLGNVIIVVPIVSIALLPALILPVQRELRRQQDVLGRR